MDLLKEGQKLAINIQKGDTLVEINGKISELHDDRMSIELPPYFMRYIEYLETGKLLTIKVFSKFGTIDFNTVVIYSPLEEGNFEVELDYNSMKLTNGDELPVISSLETLKIKSCEDYVITKTFELSTDYMKFYYDTQLNVDDQLECQLILSDGCGTISFRATVTEVDNIYDNEYKASLYSMTEQDRENLLYYIYLYANNSEQE